MLDAFIKEKKQELINKQKKLKLHGCCNKPLHGQYLSRNNKKRISCWRWLRTGYIKKETESLLTVAQDQKLVTKAYKVTILRQQGSKKCKIWKKRDWADNFSECSKLAQTEYKKDNVATMAHWELCSKCDFPKAGMSTEQE